MRRRPRPGRARKPKRLPERTSVVRGRYRYDLRRHWMVAGERPRYCTWILLHPGLTEDDPTLRRCEALTRALGPDRHARFLPLRLPRAPGEPPVGAPGADCGADERALPPGASPLGRLETLGPRASRRRSRRAGSRRPCPERAVLGRRGAPASAAGELRGRVAANTATCRQTAPSPDPSALLTARWPTWANLRRRVCWHAPAGSVFQRVERLRALPGRGRRLMMPDLTSTGSTRTWPQLPTGRMGPCTHRNGPAASR